MFTVDHGIPLYTEDEAQKDIVEHHHSKSWRLYQPDYLTKSNAWTSGLAQDEKKTRVVIQIAKATIHNLSTITTNDFATSNRIYSENLDN